MPRLRQSARRCRLSRPPGDNRRAFARSLQMTPPRLLVARIARGDRFRRRRPTIRLDPLVVGNLPGDVTPTFIAFLPRPRAPRPRNAAAPMIALFSRDRRRGRNRGTGPVSDCAICRGGGRFAQVARREADSDHGERSPIRPRSNAVHCFAFLYRLKHAESCRFRLSARGRGRRAGALFGTAVVGERAPAAFKRRRSRPRNEQYCYGDVPRPAKTNRGRIVFIVERLFFQASSRCDQFYANDARPPIKNLGSACAPPSRTDAHAAFDEELRWLAREVPCLLKIEFKAPRPRRERRCFGQSGRAEGEENRLSPCKRRWENTPSCRRGRWRRLWAPGGEKAA